MKVKVLIYVLIDPFTFKIKYIGRTKSTIKLRLQGHISVSYDKETPKDYWIQKLLKSKKKPIIRVFRSLYCTWEESHNIEKDLIKKCINFEFKLKNLDDRGEGNCNKIITKQQKLQISTTLKERYRNGLVIEQNLRPVKIYDLQNNFVKSFNSIKECVQFINPKNLVAGLSGIEKCLYNRTISKSYKGYRIFYKEELVLENYYIKPNPNCKVTILIDTLINKKYTFNSINMMCIFLKTQNQAIKKFINSNKLYRKRYTIQVPQQ